MQIDTAEASRARSSAPVPRTANETATLKARMRAVAASLHLPRYEAQALEAMIDLWQPAKGLFPEQATIATRALYSERRTRTALGALRGRDLITWEQRRFRGVQTSNLYRFTPRFWALVRGEGRGATAGNNDRPQAATMTARRRQLLPTNGDLPLSDPISLNGGGTQPDTPEASPSTTTPTATHHLATPPPPARSSHQAEEPPSLLARIFIEERAKLYTGSDHGTMRPEHLRDAHAQLDAFAADAAAWAQTHAIPFDLDTAREHIARDLVRRWLAHPGTIGPDAPRGFLAERAHPFGLLRGDLQRFGTLALAAWKDAHKPKPKRTAAPPTIERPARRIPADVPSLSFQPPAYLRHQLAQSSTPPATLTAHQRDEESAREQRAAELHADAELHARTGRELFKPIERTAHTPRPFGLTPERLLEAARFAEQEAAELAAAELAGDAAIDTAAPPVEHAQPQHEHREADVAPQTNDTTLRRARRRGGRVRAGSSPRQRAAFIAAIAAIASTSSDPEREQPDDSEHHQELEHAHGPRPLLRDLRARPGDHAPQRRRRAPPSST